jgi:hypothetical protein
VPRRPASSVAVDANLGSGQDHSTLVVDSSVSCFEHTSPFMARMCGRVFLRCTGSRRALTGRPAAKLLAAAIDVRSRVSSTLQPLTRILRESSFPSATLPTVRCWPHRRKRKSHHNRALFAPFCPATLCRCRKSLFLFDSLAAAGTVGTDLKQPRARRSLSLGLQPVGQSSFRLQRRSSPPLQK